MPLYMLSPIYRVSVKALDKLDRVNDGEAILKPSAVKKLFKQSIDKRKKKAKCKTCFKFGD